MTVRDVAIGEVRSCDDGLIGDGHPVVSLVLITNAFENFNGVRQCRFFNFDRLETALKSSIFLDVFAIFIERCCANGLQFSTSEHRLENRRRIDSAFCGTRTDKRVNLIDEQNDVAASVDLFQYLL